MRHKDALHSTLKQLMLQRNVKTVKQLIALHEVPGQLEPIIISLRELLACFYTVIMTWSCSADVSVPRYVRVNTLKLDVDSALLELQKKYSVLLSQYF